MSSREELQRWRFNFIPDHLIGEILSKRWADNAIPFLAMAVTVAGFGMAIPGFFKPLSLVESTRQLGEFSIVVTGLTVVMLAGGIDLSVSAIFPCLPASRIDAEVPVASPSQKSMMAQTSGFCWSIVAVTLRAVVASQLESGLATTL